jgi:DNA-directed RNA polymerase beta' subunit
MSNKRRLTEYEIKSILYEIKPQKGIPLKTSKIAVKKARDVFRKQLKTQMVYPEMIKPLQNMIIDQYTSSLMQAGESVGVISGQSIGEKQTQNTLNSFHFAGSGNKTITTGVPRVEELLNATKDPKSVNCTIFMKNKHKTIQDMRQTIGHDIVELTFKKISKSYDIYTNKQDEPWYDVFRILYNDDFDKYNDCISLNIDMNILYEFKLNMETISNIISKNYSDMTCVWSETEARLDIFVDTSEIELPENRLVFIDNDNVKEIYMEEVVQPQLYKIIICGIPGIENIYFNDDVNSFDTDGSNFKKLLGIPFIDPTQTISNNVWDIYHTLGIEAARQFLIEEFLSLMNGINICHIQLLTDKMTFTGTITSISRYSTRNEDSGPMCKASFEETLDNFVRAGVYGQSERTCGVSASIICGKVAQLGTGLCELIIDLKSLPKHNKKIMHEIMEHVPRIERIEEKVEEKDEPIITPREDPDEYSEDEDEIPRLTQELFKNGRRKLHAFVFTGSVENQSYDDENEEVIFQNDTKRMREVTLSWKDGIVLDDEVFSGYDDSHEVYMPLSDTSLLDQGRFLRIMTKPKRIKKSKSTSKSVESRKIKKSKKSSKANIDDITQQMYLDF